MKTLSAFLRSTAAALVAAVCIGTLSCGPKAPPSPLPPDPSVTEAVSEPSLEQYTVVIPENASDFERWSADLFTDILEKRTGIALPVVTDSTEMAELEILVGSTNRPQSSIVSKKDGCYCLFADENTLVLNGQGHYIGGAVGELLELICNDPKGLPLPDDDPTHKVLPKKSPRSVILLIGDGMGEGHIRLCAEADPKLLLKDNTVFTSPEEEPKEFYPLCFENQGLCKTLNIFESTTDSAAAATALATGKKTVNGALGMVPADLNGDGEENEFRSVQNVREAAALNGLSTAILSTDKLTGATPNAFLVHNSDRSDKSTILEQQKSLASTKLDYSYLQCAYDNSDILRDLADALILCSHNEKGFFLMAEEAMIDKYAEKMDYENVIRTTKRFNDLCSYCALFAACFPDTALVVTADHETGGLTKSEDGVWFFASEGEHTGENVPVLAMGPGTERFDNTLCDNTDIASFILSVINPN